MLDEDEARLLSSLYSRTISYPDRSWFPCYCKRHRTMDASVRLVKAGLIVVGERGPHQHRLAHYWRILGITEEGKLIAKLSGFDTDDAMGEDWDVY